MKRLSIGAAALLAACFAASAGAAEAASVLPWWGAPLALFLVSIVLGVVGVVAGIGGGVLFVPLVSGFFPFHIDFVRGAGLLLALAGSISGAPVLLRNGLSSLRLALPLALVGSIGSILGALAGFALPVSLLQIGLGATIMAVALLLWATKRLGEANVRADALGRLLGLNGQFHDPASGSTAWRTRHTALGIAAFGGIGFVGGLFGLGAGWANVPALNLLMGVPLKLAVGTSGLAISLINSSAAWVYIGRGALLPIIAMPSILGVMLGARIGARLLRNMPSALVRRIVILVLAVAGARTLARGLGVWP